MFASSVVRRVEMLELSDVILVEKLPLSVFKFVILVENEELGATKEPLISSAI